MVEAGAAFRHQLPSTGVIKMSLFDVKAVQKEAEDELRKEAIDKAKVKIKDHARKLAAARAGGHRCCHHQ